jgi:hypothetical protein
VDVISTTWTDAPAGFSGPGRLGMSQEACPAVMGGAPVVMVPVAAPIQGSGAPTAARLRPIDEPGVVGKSFLQALVASPLSVDTSTTYIDNNGTTLGIHPPGRPQS